MRLERVGGAGGGGGGGAYREQEGVGEQAG